MSRRRGTDWDWIDAAINEPEPISEDLEIWAQWWDRKAAAAVRLREHANVIGDHAGAETAAVLEDKSIWAAAELRRHLR